MRILGILLALLGLPLIIGGVWLVALGGSFYYLVMGTAVMASGWLIARGRINGVWLYWGALLFTVIWALWEVGLNYWQLMPRLVVPLLLAIPVTWSMPKLEPDDGRRSARARVAYSILGTFVLILVGMGVSAFYPRYLIAGRAPRPAENLSFVSDADTEWRHYGRTSAGTRFSPADQINADNVDRLEVAWTYRMGDPQHRFGEHQVTPLQVGKDLYFCTDRNTVIALDVDTGMEKWRFDPKTVSTTYNRCRGVAYHETPADFSTRSGESCRRRVITSTVNVRLIAIDADTGQPCADFGEGGFVDLKAGMGEVKHDLYMHTSAPTVVRDLIVVGALVRDGINTSMPSGVVRAFSVKTGALVWAFDPGNPAITRLPPEGETYSRGTPNMWSTPSYDEALGLIYVPLGEPTDASDFWGGWRTPQVEKYANSVVALEIDSGRPRWSFQAVHHDVWDYDLPPQPSLFDMPDGKGGSIPALIQASKRGQIFVLDRRDGKPIVPVVEKPVPQGGQPDDRLSPTQPYSGLPSVGTEPLTEARMWGMTLFDQLWCRIQFKDSRYEGEFTPITTQRRTLVYPGLFGGVNWGGIAVDEARGYLVVNDIRMPMRFKLLPREQYNRRVLQAQAEAEKTGNHWPSAELPPEVPYGSEGGMFMSPLDIPCSAPPWGTLTAIDLSARTVVWQRPIGTVRDTGPLGLKLGLPLQIGLPTLGGSIVTRSGLVFIGGTRDFYLRAMDVHTGKELWKGRLPVGAQATPMTYISPHSGRQFVVIVAGGVSLGKEKGDYVIAYALPDRSAAR